MAGPNLPPDALRDLLAQTAAGDMAAFERLHHDTRAALHALAVRIACRHEVAEEIVQETFVKVWRHAGSFDPDKGSAFAWMVTILRHSAVDQLRLDVKHADAVCIDEHGDVAFNGATPDQIAIGRQEARRVANHLYRLRPSQRQALNLAYLQERTHEEISSIMQVPTGTVKSWVRRGLQHLRAQPPRVAGLESCAM